jgi:hypothetical protein
MENIYQALGRGLRQTAGDLEGFQGQVDKGKELRLTLEKMIQDRAMAIEQQRQLEIANQMAEFENQHKMDATKRQEDHRHQIRMQREKAAQQAMLEQQKAQAQPPEPGGAPGWAAPAPQAGPQPMVQQPMATQAAPRPGPQHESVYGMADDLYGANAIEGKDWLDFQTRYAKASGALQDPEMALLKKETEKARAAAQAALANLRNRTDPNRRGGGGKGQVDANALANILAYDEQELAAVEAQITDLGPAPSQYSSEAMGYRLAKQALETQLRAISARMVRNAMKATSPEVLPPAMGGTSRGKTGGPKRFKYTPQGLVPKG